ncbi:MAG TPA: ABC-2 family transporter protein [Bacilli bacterium]|nr:ABC-2 family transporter protein [Bacilli bacterium]
MAFYWVLIRKSYLSNLQYRAAHMINNLGSMLFGLMFIAIWQGTLGEGRQVVGFGGQEMGQYIAFTQSILFQTKFLQRGFGMDEGIRTGSISLQLMRPVSFFGYYLAFCAGSQAYNLFFRTVPLLLIFALFVGLPDFSWSMWLPLAGSVAMAFYLGFLMNYFVGVAAFWTKDIRWSFIVFYTLNTTLSGFMVPLPVMPGVIGDIVPYLPWSGMNYYPVMTYLGHSSVRGFVIPLIWCAVLTVVALLITRRARSQMEVQGG